MTPNEKDGDVSIISAWSTIKEEERTYVTKRIPAKPMGKVELVTCENLYTTEITCINIPVTGMFFINLTPN